MAVAGFVTRFTLKVFFLEIARAMELTTILNQSYHFPRFVYRYARFGPDKKSIEVAIRLCLEVRTGRILEASGYTVRIRV
jgi:hypothetical protein